MPYGQLRYVLEILIFIFNQTFRCLLWFFVVAIANITELHKYSIKPPHCTAWVNPSLRGHTLFILRSSWKVPPYVYYHYLTTIDPRAAPGTMTLSKKRTPRAHASTGRECPCFWLWFMCLCRPCNHTSSVSGSVSTTSQRTRWRSGYILGLFIRLDTI